MPQAFNENETIAPENSKQPVVKQESAVGPSRLYVPYMEKYTLSRDSGQGENTPPAGYPVSVNRAPGPQAVGPANDRDAGASGQKNGAGAQRREEKSAEKEPAPVFMPAAESPLFPVPLLAIFAEQRPAGFVSATEPQCLEESEIPAGLIIEAGGGAPEAAGGKEQPPSAAAGRDAAAGAEDAEEPLAESLDDGPAPELGVEGQGPAAAITEEGINDGPAPGPGGAHGEAGQDSKEKEPFARKAFRIQLKSENSRALQGAGHLKRDMQQGIRYRPSGDQEPAAAQ